MQTSAYVKRRNEIEAYFDHTALDAWKRLTSTEKVSGIRATVRAGRDEMRRELLSRFPDDLTGWRILDAGCGGGALAHALAGRGADVLGVDLSAQMIDHARSGLPKVTGPGRLELVSGDMLGDHGVFDAVVAMDSLIHYARGQVGDALIRLAGRTRMKIVFTLAPKTPLLATMHAMGKLFPRSDRSPAIEPVQAATLIDGVLKRADMADWRKGPAFKVQRGFYISEAQELVRR